MKKIVLGLILSSALFTVNSVDAKAKCANSYRAKVCTKTTKNTITIDEYKYKDNKRKNLASHVTKYMKRSNKKLTKQIIRKYHSKRIYSQYRTITYGSTKVDHTTNYHKNGKRKTLTQYKHKGAKNTYDQLRKFDSKGREYYYKLLKFGTTNSVTTKTFKSGKHVNMNTTIKRNNKVVQTQLTTYHKNGGYRKAVDNKIFNNNGKQVDRYTDYYSNAKYQYRTSRQKNYYKHGKRTEKKHWYYNKSGKNHGYRLIKYATNSKVSYDVRNNYYLPSKRIASKVTNLYHSNNVLSTSKNEYYQNNGKRYYMLEKKYANNKKLTSSLKHYYNNNAKIYLTKGYTYGNGNYSYVHDEYTNGLAVLKDKTTYKNNGRKSGYERSIFKGGKLTSKKTYAFDGYGNITNERELNGGNVQVSNNRVGNLYPITQGVITSSNWFYPSSFGGGWHPGIDIASYRHRTQGYAQYIKWNFEDEGVVLNRYNSCHSTRSSGCGPGGFGNSVLIAVKHKGKFYTVLYGHNTKLTTKGDSTNAKIYRSVAAGKKIKKNQIIGRVGSSGFSTGYHIHLQIQEHTYARSINDVVNRFNKHKKNVLFNVSYTSLSNYSDIVTVNPDTIFNLRYYQSWNGK